MNQVAYHLQFVIFQWCGAEAASYGLATPMPSLWARQFPVVAYDPEGIRRFMLNLYRDALFGGCQRAHQMVPGMLQSGGPLQRVGDVFNFLGACSNPEVGFSSNLRESE